MGLRVAQVFTGLCLKFNADYTIFSDGDLNVITIFIQYTNVFSFICVVPVALTLAFWTTQALAATVTVVPCLKGGENGFEDS